MPSSAFIKLFPGDGPRTPLKNAMHAVNPHFTQTFLLTTTTSQGSKLLMLETWGALSKNAYDVASMGQAPQTPEIKQYLKFRL